MLPDLLDWTSDKGIQVRKAPICSLLLPLVSVSVGLRVYQGVCGSLMSGLVAPQEEAFIQRIDALATMGYTVLLSSYRRYFKLAGISTPPPGCLLRLHVSIDGPVGCLHRRSMDA